MYKTKLLLSCIYIFKEKKKNIVNAGDESVGGTFK